MVDEVQFRRMLYEGDSPLDVGDADKDVFFNDLAQLCQASVSDHRPRQVSSLTMVFASRHSLPQLQYGRQCTIRLWNIPRFDVARAIFFSTFDVCWVFDRKHRIQSAVLNRSTDFVLRQSLFLQICFWLSKMLSISI